MGEAGRKGIFFLDFLISLSLFPKIGLSPRARKTCARVRREALIIRELFLLSLLLKCPAFIVVVVV